MDLLIISLASGLPEHAHILHTDVLGDAAYDLNAGVSLSGHQVRMSFDCADSDCHWDTFSVERFHTDLLAAGFQVESITVM